MKKSTSLKSKSKFAKKRANAKNPKTTDKVVAKSQANPSPQPPPPQDAKPTEVIGGPTPEPAPCSPAITQAGHHEVVQS